MEEIRAKLARQSKMYDKIYCKSTVKMYETEEVAFTEGQTYYANLDAYYINAIDNMGEVHCLGTIQDEDKFFHTHFLKEAE